MYALSVNVFISKLSEDSIFEKLAAFSEEVKMIKNSDKVEIELGDLQVDGEKEEKLVIREALKESLVELKIWVTTALKN